MLHKELTIALVLMTQCTVAQASPRLRSLYNNYLLAQETERTIKRDYLRVKDAYKASREKTDSAKDRFNSAKKDELKEDRQLRKLISASRRETKTPNYYYESGNGSAQLIETAKEYF